MEGRTGGGAAGVGATGIGATALVIVIVTLLGGGPGRSAGTPPPQPPPQAAAARPDAPAPPSPPSAPAASHGSGRRLIEDFLGVASIAPSLAAPRRDPFGTVSTCPARTVACYELQVVVATLPDPLDSGLDWAFDAGWEAVRRAFERAGWVMDRYWFPWSTADSTGRGATHTERPGAVLFRSRDPQHRALRLVYLVGEVPTTGIYKQAMAAALREADSLLTDGTLVARDTRDPTIRYAAEACNVRCGRELPIVGPTFSGSATSLRLALRAHGATAAWTGYRIISGAASNDANVCVLSWTDGPVPATYSAAVHVDRVLSEVRDDVLLRRLDIDAARVAILREGTTQYGQLSAPDADAVRDADRASTSPPDTANVRCPTASAGARGPRPLEIPFPISISRLRSAIERDDVPEAAGAPFGGTQAAPPLDLREPGRTRTTPPVFSELTPPAIAGVVDEIAQTLVAHRIQAVGIVASDVRDVLFLAREVRKRFRDVLIFTYNSNTLYAHPQFNVELRGMLMFSTYPLSIETQYWTARDTSVDRQRVAFTTNLAQGVFNATLRQLGVGDAELGSDHARLVAEGAETPVWVTVVGRGALFPVALIERPRGAGVRSSAAFPRGGDGPHPPLALSGIAFAAGVAVVLTAAAARACGRFPALGRWMDARLRRTTARRDRSAAPRTWLHDWVVAQRGAAQAALAGAAALLLSLVGLVLHRWTSDAWYVAFRVAAIAAAIAIAWLVLDALYSAVRPRAPDDAESSVGPVPLEKVATALVALGVIVLAAIAVAHVAHAGARDELEVNRRVHLWRFVAIGSGVSPALPLALGAMLLALWAVWHRRRADRFAEVPELERFCALLAVRAASGDAAQPAALVPVPTDPRADETATRRADAASLFPSRPMCAAIRRVRGGLLLTPVGRAGWFGAAFVVVLLAWALAQAERTMEAVLFASGAVNFDAFAFVLHVTILLSLAATAVALARFLGMWASFHEVLTALALSPLFPAFRRLPIAIARLTRLGPRKAPADEIVDGALRLHWQEWRRERGKGAGTGGVRDGAAVAAAVARDDEVPCLRRCANRGDDLTASIDTGLVDLVDEMSKGWREVPARARTAADDPKADPSGDVATADAHGRVRAQRRAEECVAMFAVEYIEWALHQLRLLAAFVLGAAVLTTLLIASYPVRPQSAAKLASLVLLLGTSGALLFVLYNANRNDVLSAVTHTDPGRVTWDGPFITNVVVFVLVPLLTLLSTEVPEVREFLFSWLTPLLRSVGRM